jgi:hypothetical protein
VRSDLLLKTEIDAERGKSSGSDNDLIHNPRLDKRTAFTGGRSVGLFDSVEKCLCRFEIGRVEAFGEAVVDRLQERYLLRVTTPITPQPEQQL